MKFFKLSIFLALFIALSANAILEVNIVKTREAAFPLVIAPLRLLEVQLTLILQKSLETILTALDNSTP